MAELQLDPQKTALVLIDLQNAVLGMTPAPHSADKVVENSVKLANAFRAKGAPVVYVRVDLNDFLKLPSINRTIWATNPCPPWRRRSLLLLAFSPATSSLPSVIGAPSPALTWSSSSRIAGSTRSS